MTVPGQPTGNAAPYSSAWVESRPTFYRALAALLALIAIAVVVGGVDVVLQGHVPSLSAALAAWSWVVTVFLILLCVVIAIWTWRLVFWGVGSSSPMGRHELRHHRHAYRGAPWDWDPAVEIARQRFARGEITEEQLDQALRGLSKS